MTTVKQTITGDSASAQKAYADLARQVAKLEAANQRLVGEVDKFATKGVRGQRAMNDFVQHGVSLVSSMAVQWVGVTAMISAATAAAQEYYRVIRETADVQITVGDAQAKLFKNLATSTTPEKIAFTERVTKMQQESGFQSLPAMLVAAAEGASASAGNIPATEEALRASVALTRDEPQDLQTLVGAALDIQKASGVNDAKKNLGFLMQVGTESRVAGLRNTALTVAPAVSTAAKTVTSDQRQATIDAGALFAALSNEGVDPTGETTRNAVQVVSGELRSFFQEGVKVNRPGGGRPMLIKPKSDPNTIEGRLRVLQEDPRLRKAFMDTANFGRERFRIPFEQLVNKGQTATAFEQARRNLSFDDKTYNQLAAELESATPQMKLSTQAKASQATTEGYKNAKTPMGIMAEVIKTRDEADTLTRNKYGQGGAWFLDPARKYVIDQVWSDDADKVQGSIEFLQERQNFIRTKGRSLLGNRGVGLRDPSQLNPQEKQDFDYLGEKIEELNRYMADLLQVQRDMNATIKAKTPSAAGAAQAEAGKGRER